MQAGKLRHRVTFQNPPTAQNSTGQVTGSYTTLATRWGSIEPLSGRELVNAQQISAEVTHRIRVRWLSGIAPKVRAVFGSRNFDILSVLNPEERKRELELLVREKV